MDVQAGRMVAVARDRPQSAVERSATRAGELEAQLQRLDSAQSAALLAGDRRRAALLDVRRARVRERLSSQQAGAGPQLANQWTGASRAHTQAERMGAYLDEQAALPAARRARGEVGRDYPALAGLLGMSRERYEGLDPVGRRAARLEIDRELAKRRAALRDSGSIVGSDPGQAPRPHSERPVRSEGGRSETGGSPKAIPRREPESEIMADARAVAEGRKRQLGFGQP
jgi:hypothetical protein